MSDKATLHPERETGLAGDVEEEPVEGAVDEDGDVVIARPYDQDDDDRR